MYADSGSLRTWYMHVTRPRITPGHHRGSERKRPQLIIALRLRPAQWRNVYLFRTHLSRILDLLAEDSWLNVYAGELEVRPPAAPTTGAGWSGTRPGKPRATHPDRT